MPSSDDDCAPDCGRGTSQGRVLDLFCGVGGAARGLQDLCGYEVVGFDIEEQPKYPGEFHQRDLRDGLPPWVFEEEWAGVWASPPCTPFTSIEAFQSGENLIPLARQLAHSVDTGFRIIENVPGARDHLRDPTTLQGGAFSPPLDVQKERVFETNFRAVSKTAPGASYAFCIGDREAPVGDYREAHGFAYDCDLTAKELRECIPPAYVDYLVSRWLCEGESRQEVLA